MFCSDYNLVITLYFNVKDYTCEIKLAGVANIYNNLFQVHEY